MKLFYWRLLIIAGLIIFGFSLISCNSAQKSNDEAVKRKAVKEAGDTTESRIVKLGNTLFSVPSPYQAAIFINNQKIPYNNEVLNEVNKAPKYNSTFYRSANLGVYGADLAYITLYEQSPDAMNYFSVIKMLAEKLELMAAFDKKTVQRLEHNISNQDSLLHILGNTYRDADAYFKSNEQEHLACLVIAGGWIESMYLLTHLGSAKDKELKKRVGENKKPLDNLIQLLAPYRERNNEYQQLTEKLLDLAGIYENVSIDYQFIDAQTDPEKRITKVKNQTVIEMDNAILDKITQSIGEIRASIVKKQR